MDSKHFPNIRGILVAFLFISQGSFSQTQLSLAIFSKRQIFWPAMDSAWKADSARIGVLPVYLESYQESRPCDSCNRLSEDGMEFFLDNALRRILDTAFSGSEVQLVGPHWDLLKSRKVVLPALLDSLKLPWEQWLGDDLEPLIYRTREAMASLADKTRLDKAASALGFSHVFVVKVFKVSVFPMSRNTHFGSMDWEWKGALYNAREGRFEWALRFSQSLKAADLDKDLEPLLSGELIPALRDLPSKLSDLLRQEPR